LLLHRDEKPGLKVEGFTALDPLDSHPRGERDRVRAMVKANR
jgi:hypothetical protein